MSPPKKGSEAAAKLAAFRRLEKEAPIQDGAGPSLVVEEPESPATSKVLEAIATCQTMLTTKIEEVKVDISLMRQDMQKLRDRVGEAEHRISEVEDSLPPLQSSSDRLQQQVHLILQKQDDMENRLRRCNLRFIGLPEGSEGADPSSYLEQLLTQTYGRESFSSTFVVERAHRLSGRPPPQGAPPRTFIAKFLNYRDRDAILRLARVKGNIPFGNHKIAIFPDFSAEVQRRRKSFLEVKRRLRIKNIKYSMLYPARLRVEGEDRAHFFEDPEAAISWLEGLEARA